MFKQHNEVYKARDDIKKRNVQYQIGYLVIVYLRKYQFPNGQYNKLKMKKFGPLSSSKKIRHQSIFLFPHVYNWATYNSIIIICYEYYLVFVVSHTSPSYWFIECTLIIMTHFKVLLELLSHQFCPLG